MHRWLQVLYTGRCIRHTYRSIILHNLVKREFSYSSKHFNDSLEKFTVRPNNKDDTDELPDFFKEKDELRINVKKYFESKLRNHPVTLPSRPLNMSVRDIDDLILEKSYAAEKSFKDIVESNDTLSPIIGSIIKYRDPVNENIHTGIVLRNSLSKFNDYYNKLVVLTESNMLDAVYPQDILLHLHGVFDPEWIKSLNILENRHDDTYYSRNNMVNLLTHLINQSKDIQHQISSGKNLLKVSYSKHCEDEISAVDLWEIIDSLEFEESFWLQVNRDYFTQCCLLLGTFNAISEQYDMFLLPNMFSNLSNTNIFNGFSNNLTKPSQVLILPIPIFESFRKLESIVANEISLKYCNEFLHSLINQQNSVTRKPLSELHVYFNIWEGKTYNSVLDVIKFASIYPHEKIVSNLSKLDIFKNDQSLNHFTEVLENLGIYSKTTDIFSSLNLWGHSTVTKKVSFERKEPLTPKFDFLESKNIKRGFNFLETDELGSGDMIYALPINASLKVGVSLQKLNSRNYNVNIHLPDVVTRISPKSKIFQEMALKCYKKLLTILPFNSSSLFDPRTNDLFDLKEQFTENDFQDFISVGDIGSGVKQKTLKNTNDQSCLTLSFKYKTFESNPFKDFKEKVKFSLLDISKVPIKCLDVNTLREALNHKGSSLPFTLFRNKASQESHRLTKNDYHNLGFIYNVLRAHFMVRNIDGAVNIQLSDTFEKEKFFLDELDKFSSNLTSYYCKINEIPVILKSQSIMEEQDAAGTQADEVLVKHNNLLLPEFHANSYYQTLIARDINGNVSLAAYIIGNNFLSPPKLGLERIRDVPSALGSGYISLLNPGDSFEAFFNQFQIISSMHSDYIAKTLFKSKIDLYKFQKRFAYLKGLGYNLNGPWPNQVVNKYVTSLKNTQIVNKYAYNLVHKYWALRDLEDTLSKLNISKDLDLECIITSTGYNVPDYNFKLAKCFVKDLNIECDILLNEPKSLSIGDVLKSNTVLYLNPSTSTCVLGENASF